MHVEDSYEGALRRLNRLRLAGVELAPPVEPEPADDDDGGGSERMRELEELATLACDDNERLTAELDGARSEIARLQRLAATLREMMQSAQADAETAAPSSAEVERLTQELVSARGEIEHLKRLVAMLHEQLAGDAPAAAFETNDEALDVPKKRTAMYFVLGTGAAIAVALLFVTRPWQSRALPVLDTPSASVASAPATSTAPSALPSTTATAPAIAATAPATTTTTATAPTAATAAPSAPTASTTPTTTIPKLDPTTSKTAVTIPKAAPTIPKMETAKPARRHAAAKRHAAKTAARHKAHKRGAVAKSSSGKLNSHDDDPLGGLGM